MYGHHKIGLFKVIKVEEFQGYVDFDIKPKIFLTYDQAYEYVLEAFKRNYKCIPWGSRYTFDYEVKDDDTNQLVDSKLVNYVKIEMILPFYLHIGREWL